MLGVRRRLFVERNGLLRRSARQRVSLSIFFSFPFFILFFLLPRARHKDEYELRIPIVF